MASTTKQYKQLGVSVRSAAANLLKVEADCDHLAVRAAPPSDQEDLWKQRDKMVRLSRSELFSSHLARSWI